MKIINGSETLNLPSKITEHLVINADSYVGLKGISSSYDIDIHSKKPTSICIECCGSLSHLTYFGPDIDIKISNCHRGNILNLRLEKTSAKLDLQDNSCPVGISLLGSYIKDLRITNTYISRLDLSQTTGIPSVKSWLDRWFGATNEGYIVYKTFGVYYYPPQSWIIQPNSIIEETVNPNWLNDCSSGISFTTKEALLEAEYYERHGVWQCLLRYEDLGDVVVPLASRFITPNDHQGARAGKLTILERIN